MNCVNIKLAENIREARETAKISQKDLGILCGWSQSHQCKMETGRHPITVKQVLVLAQALGIEPVTILDELLEL